MVEVILLPKESLIEDSIRFIKKNTWLVGKSFILRRSVKDPGPGGLFDGSAFWVVDTNVPSPPPPSEPAVNVKGVFERFKYDQDKVVLWRLGPYGRFLLKGKRRQIGNAADFANMKLLRKLDQEKPLSFSFPTVYHVSHEGRSSFCIEKRIRGVTLGSVWWSFSEERKNRVATQVADALIELTRATSDSITGADGTPIVNFSWLTRQQISELDDGRMDPEETKVLMEANIRAALGPKLVEGPKVFTHADISSRNVLLDPEDPEYLGLIDWERSGYYPRQAIATDILQSSAMLTSKRKPGGSGWIFSPEYGNLVLAALAKSGFRTYDKAYWRWRKEKWEEGYVERRYKFVDTNG